MSDFYIPQSLNGFEKQVALNGSDKVAILFGELGSAATAQLMEQFSTKELKKIRKCLERTPHPRVPALSFWKKEVKVLEQTMDFGLRHRLTTMDSIKMEDAYYKRQANEDKQRDFREGILKNADSVANILKMWMDED